MALFNLGKKNGKTKEPTCACACHEQFENTKKAVTNIGISLDVEYITDMEKVMAYGVMSMPAIVINEKVVSMGKVLKVTEVENLIHKMRF